MSLLVSSIWYSFLNTIFDLPSIIILFCGSFFSRLHYAVKLIGKHIEYELYAQKHTGVRILNSNNHKYNLNIILLEPQFVRSVVCVCVCCGWICWFHYLRALHLLSWHCLDIEWFAIVFAGYYLKLSDQSRKPIM